MVRSLEVGRAMREGVLLLCCAGICFGLSGCGAGNATNPVSTGPVTNPLAATNLNGNWLLTGSLPTFPSPITTAPGLSMTFSAADNAVTGTGTALIACGGLSGGGTSTGNGAAIGFGVSALGTVQADGSFKAQTSSGIVEGGTVPSVTVTGTVPKAPQGSWSGTYVIDPGSLNGSCSGSQSGTFTATPIQAVSGTFTGTGTLTQGSMQSTFSVTVEVQQGLTVAAADGSSTFNSSLLSGSIQVQGLPCFSSGSIVQPAPQPPGVEGAVEGSHVIALFRMNDGSQLSLLGSISDQAASQISSPGLAVFPGTCTALQGASLRLGTLAKQS